MRLGKINIQDAVWIVLIVIFLLFYVLRIGIETPKQPATIIESELNSKTIRAWSAADVERITTHNVISVNGETFIKRGHDYENNKNILKIYDGFYVITEKKVRGKKTYVVF